VFTSLSPGAIGVRLPFDECVELAAHFGFEGISLDVGWAAKNGPSAVVQILEERDMRPGGWGLPLRLLGPQDQFEEGMAKLGETADIAARCGDTRCSTWVPSASDEAPYEELFELLRERVTAVAKVLSEYDARLGLEFLGPRTLRAGRKYEFIHTMDQMLELTRSVETANVGLLLDCWHLYTSGGSMDDVLRLSDRDVVMVHINDAPAGVAIEDHVDNVRGLPGETGVIGVPRFLANLRQIGYTGPVMAEPFSERVRQMPPEQAIEVTKKAIDSVWPD